MSLVNPFEILDNIGSPRVFDIHMRQNIVAYESGNGILLWDLEVDKKVKLHNHESQVQVVFFGGSLDDKYVISLDGLFKVSIFISEWDTLRRVHQIYVPHKNRKKPVKSVIANYDKKNNLILVMENEEGGGYRLSVWEFKNEKLVLQFISDVDNNNCGLFIDCFNIVDQTHQTTTQIAIAEKNCIKYFKISNTNQVVLTNRVHLKENIINMSINSTYNIVIALLHTGKIIIIDAMGELVSQIKHQSLIFSSFSSVDNMVFCGGNNGSICIYDISNCKLIQEIPYDSSIRKSSTIHIQPQDDIFISSGSQRKSFGSSFDYKVRNNEIKKKNNGPAVCALKNSSDGNLLVAVYSDGTQIVMEVKSQSILHKQVGHTGRINQIVWDKQNKKRFYAVADDGILSLWDFNGDRWLPKMIDLSQTIDNFSKTNQQILSEYHLREKPDDEQTSKGKQKSIQIKSICLNYLKDEIYCGDNKGNLYIFDSNNGKYITKHNLSGFKISSMSISPGCKYLGVFLTTGLTLIFDCTNRFSLQIKLEDSSEKQTHPINPGVILLEDSMNSKQSFKDSFSLNTINNVDKSFLSILQGSNNKSKQYYHQNKSDNSFLAITIHSQNSLRLHSISQVGSTQMNSIVTANFSVEGLIQSFAVHPSNQYVLILSNVGYVYIFNLKSSELRGKIDVPKYSQRLTIDPSGLYFAITAFSTVGEENEHYLSANVFNSSYNSLMRTDKSTLSIYNPQKEVDLFFKKKPDVKPVRVILFEIGTGNLVGDIPSLFNIECLQLSEEGKFISIGSSSGIISMWSTCQEVRENIFEVLDQMRVKEDFWRDFPIYLTQKENVLEENNLNDDYHERNDRKGQQDDISENLNLSTKSIQIGTNYFQKQGIPKTGRDSQKEARIVSLNCITSTYIQDLCRLITRRVDKKYMRNYSFQTKNNFEIQIFELCQIEQDDSYLTINIMSLNSNGQFEFFQICLYFYNQLSIPNYPFLNWAFYILMAQYDHSFYPPSYLRRHKIKSFYFINYIPFFNISRETSRIIEPKIQQQLQYSPEQEKGYYQKAKSMNFYDTQNKLPLSSVGGTLNNIQAKLLDRNPIESGNFDRFYRSKNDLSIIEKQQTPLKNDHINPPQESIKAQQDRSNLTSEKIRELNFRNRELEKQDDKQQNQERFQRNVVKDNHIATHHQQLQGQQSPQFQQKQEQRRSFGAGQVNNPSQFGNIKHNPREQLEEPQDIDDDVIVTEDKQIQNKQIRQQSPDEVGWRQQQLLYKKNNENHQQRRPINQIRNSHEYDDIPSPSSVRQSERSDSQFDQIERFETKLKNNKIEQQNLYSKQY